jgi:hypothetical protein
MALRKMLYATTGLFSAYIAGAIFLGRISVRYSTIFGTVYAAASLVYLYFFVRIWNTGPQDSFNSSVGRVLVPGDFIFVTTHCQWVLLALGAYRVRGTRIAMRQTKLGAPQAQLTGGMGRWPRKATGQRLTINVRQHGSNFCLVKIESTSFWPKLPLLRYRDDQNINRALALLLRMDVNTSDDSHSST